MPDTKLVASESQEAHIAVSEYPYTVETFQWHITEEKQPFGIFLKLLSFPYGITIKSTGFRTMVGIYSRRRSHVTFCSNCRRVAYSILKTWKGISNVFHVYTISLFVNLSWWNDNWANANKFMLKTNDWTKLFFCRLNCG